MMLRDTSPFYSRNYGGLSQEQIDFLRPYISSEPDQILDPMSGQAYFLSSLAHQGRHVHLGDINPGPLLLATLRDPELTLSAANLRKWLLEYLSLPRIIPTGRTMYSDDWVPQGLGDQLKTYVSQLGLDRYGPPLQQKFWRAPKRIRFATAMAVLAARQIACYTASDNLTWLKRGGLQTSFDIRPLLTSALEGWFEYACQQAEGALPKGKLAIEPMNAAEGCLGSSRAPDLIITSPPYANRLDYTRLWAPELEVLAAMFGFQSRTIKADQIGSTVISARPAASVEGLPSEVQNSLERIRDDNLYASSSYYFPFFVNYAVSISKTFTALGKLLSPGGVIVVFVRDTARKDVMFPAGKLVETVLSTSGVTDVLARREVIVRSHVGVRRRNAKLAAHGLAQREWWIALRKAT